MSTRHLAALLLALAAGRAARSQAPAAPAAADTAPPIEDNSFLVEEAYNQPRGVVQHIGTFARFNGGAGWVATFTQEWPLGGQRHQLSYTAAEVHPDAARTAPHIGDLALNYRFQARDRGGVLVAPRITVVLPTGSARLGAGAGGVGLQANLPVTHELSPRWSIHSNVGGTVVPRGHDEDGGRVSSTNLTLAQSVIWLARPTFNVLVEGLWSHTATVPAGSGSAEHETLAVVSPGVRYAVNLASGMQIVPGVAVPFTVGGNARRSPVDVGVFAYFSVEHAFAHTH